MKKQHKCQIVMQVLLIKFSRFSSHRCLERKSGNTSFYYPPVRFALTWPPPLVTNEIKLNEIEFPRALFPGSRFSTFCAIRNGNVLIHKMCSRHVLSFFHLLCLFETELSFFFFSLKKLDISWNQNSISNRRVILKR